MNSFSSVKWMLLIGLIVALNAFLINADPATLPITYKDYKYSPIKRNTWWSKKSLPEDVKFNALNWRFVDVISYIGKSNSGSAMCPEIIGSEECYVDNCVTSFFTCIRMMTDLGSSGLHCKLKHHDCLTGCCQNSKELLALVGDTK